MKQLLILLFLASCSTCNCGKKAESKWVFPDGPKDSKGQRNEEVQK